MNAGPALSRIARRQWFLLGLIVALVGAAASPALGAKHGPLHPEWSVHLAIAIAFLISGLTMPMARLTAAFGQLRLHVFIQAFSFLAVPLLVEALLPALNVLGMPAALGQGFVILSCLPTTIASCAIFTRAAGGNEAAALCNAALGNLIGLVVTPALLLLLLGATGEAPMSQVLRQLSLEVLAPMLAGQIAQRLMRREDLPMAGALRLIPSVIILFIIYTVFCATFADRELQDLGRAVWITALAVAALHVALLLLCWRLSALDAFVFTRGDRIAALFCATQKTLALGIPMVTVLYGQRTDLVWLTLPLLIYHPLQLVVSGVLAARLLRSPGPDQSTLSMMP